MNKISKIGTIALTAVLFGSVITSCNKDKDKDNDKNKDKPTIENLAVTPSASVKYGDVLTLTGKFSDNNALSSYSVKITDAKGEELITYTQPLVGTSFDLDLKYVLPLPKNAEAGDVTISVSLRNANESADDELKIANVTVPTIDNLYLKIDQRTYKMEKDGDDFSVIDFFNANAKGIIYINSALDGMFWGGSGAALTGMSDQDITINSSDNRAFLKITFNPKTFTFSVSQVELEDIDEVYYIQGTISGHWYDQCCAGWDEFGINVERDIVKLKGQKVKDGVRKIWTWSARDDANGENINWDLDGGSQDTWWGGCNAGAFSLKKGDASEYILWDGTKTIKGSNDDLTKRFTIETGGWGYYVILDFDGTNYRVTIDHNGPYTEFTVDGFMVNGLVPPASMSFGAGNLTKVNGSNYKFEGIVTLTKGESYTAEGMNLRNANADGDVFLGQGQSSWEMKGLTGEWLIRLDPLLGNVYVCLQSGYPDAIYMDGWSWAKFSSNPGENWGNNYLCLQKGADSKYTATFYNFGWGDGDVNGADVKFFSKATSTPNFGKHLIPAKYFDINEDQYKEEEGAGGLFMPKYEGNMKVTIDLKDGFDFGEGEDTDQFWPCVPKTAGQKFTITFDEL